MEVCTLASGSSGNSLLICCGSTYVLLDAGISARRITSALKALGADPTRLSAVLVTHEHTDHVSGLATLTKQLGVPVYATAPTLDRLERKVPALARLGRALEAGTGFQLGELWVESFSTPHDAAGSVGYAVTGGGARMALATDLGHLTPQVWDAARGADLLVCETNHDEDWVRSGPYPYALKQRILGDRGHLSNEAGAELAALAVGQSFILPGPAAVLGTLIQLAGVPSFWQTALLSLVRVLAGLLAGTLLGALTAALTCASRWADVLLSPAVRVIRAVPVVSFILFVLLWTRRGLVPVVVSALMVLPVVWGNVGRGIRETDPKLLEQAGALRFSRLKTVRLVYLPSVRPYFLSAVVTSLGLAWKSGVAAEVLCRPAWAVGTQIVQARDYLETPSLFAWTLVILLLSLTLEKLLSALLNRINRRWSP